MTTFTLSRPTREDRVDSAVIYEISIVTQGSRYLIEGDAATLVDDGARQAAHKTGAVILQIALVSCGLWCLVRAPSTVAPITLANRIKAHTTKLVKDAGLAKVLWDPSAYIRSVTPSESPRQDLEAWVMSVSGFSRSSIEEYYAGLAAEALADAAQATESAVLTPAEAAEQADLEPPTNVPAEALHALAPVPDTAMPTTAKPRAKRVRYTKIEKAI
jgi:hypothetical protein